MPDPVRALTRLFRWGAPAPARSGGKGLFYGAETEVALRFRALLDAHAPAASTTDGEALRAALLPVVKTFIAGEQAEIEAAHRAGARGLEVVARQADLVDAVISQLFWLSDRVMPRGIKERTEGCALVALGGYGRRELNPASDVDVMFLYPRRVDEYVKAVLDHILYFLWDLGFTVGHSAP